MDPQPRTVGAARGWAWIVEGFQLFLRSPALFVALLLILFIAKKVLYMIPFLGLAALLSIVAVLLMPVFVVGLMDGCRSLDQGGKLELGHLMKGFQKNPGQLVTIGGISLVGNLVILMVIVAIGGDSMTAMARTLSENPTITPQMAEQLQAATMNVAKAALIGATLSLPLLMALWFAPLLVYFNDTRPFEAMKLSFVACLKNALPMLVYGAVLFIGLMVLVPIGVRFKEYDLGLWLLAPVLVPSIYTSYKDLFAAARAGERAGPFLSS
ncbi:MAG TPA: BPSS1780 family membrane protein [Burkholderiales bacterium]|nr:BPSS1780 family membrane protein [Burkholderiales bacterium]